MCHLIMNGIFFNTHSRCYLYWYASLLWAEMWKKLPTYLVFWKYALAVYFSFSYHFPEDSSNSEDCCWLELCFLQTPVRSNHRQMLDHCPTDTLQSNWTSHSNDCDHSNPWEAILLGTWCNVDAVFFLSVVNFTNIL